MNPVLRVGSSLLALCALASSALRAQVWTHARSMTNAAVAFAFDPQRQRLIALEVDQDGRAATWELDGATWLRRENAYRFPAVQLVITDPVHARVLAFDLNTVVGWRAYDGVDWRPIGNSAPMPSPYDSAVAYDTARDQIVAFGGSGFLFGQVTALDSMWTWQAGTGSQVQPGGNWPPPRIGARMANDPVRGRVVMVGGYDANYQPLADTWEWDGASWAQFTGAGPGPRGGGAMAFDAVSQAVILYGGWDGQGFPTTTHAFDGQQWRVVAGAGVPGPNSPSADVRMVEAPGGPILAGQTLVRGAIECWQFVGGTTWLQIAGAPSPAPRMGAAMAYDAERGQIVLTGGFSDEFSAFARTDTWVFDGAWRQAQPRQNVPVRLGAAMVCDRARGEVLLFGGSDMRGDTWAWDGSDWHKRLSQHAPSPRKNHRMSYDRVRDRVVLFGGDDGTNLLGDTWQWNGVDWQQFVGGPSPAPRASHLQAFDQASGRTFVVDNDMWAFDGVAWAQLAPVHLPNLSVGQASLGMEYDERRGALVVVMPQHEWLWNGLDWIGPTASPRPLPTSVPTSVAMVVYDEARGGLAVLTENQMVGDRGLYVATPTPHAQAAYGSGCAPAGVAIPDLYTVGMPVPGEQRFTVGIRAEAPGRPALVGLGLASLSLSIGGGCALLVDQVAYVASGASGANGFADFVLGVPQDLALRSLQLFAQGGTLTASGGLALTRGLQVTIGD